MLSEFLLLRHRSRSPSEASSFLHYPISRILVVITLCICLLTLTFLMRTGWKMKSTTKQNAEMKGDPGFPWKAMQDWDRNGPQPRRCVTWWPWVYPTYVRTCHIPGPLYMLLWLALILAFWRRLGYPYLTEEKWGNWLLFKRLAVWGLHRDGLGPAQRWGSAKICQI